MTTALIPAQADTDAALIPTQTADPLTAFADFLRLRVADGDASPLTVKAYQSNVAAFVAWCQEQGINPAQVTDDDLTDYRRALVEQGLSRATIAARLGAVRRFFEAATWRGLRTDNPAAGLKPPRDKTAQAERVKFLPLDALIRLKSQLPKGELIRARDAALLTVFLLHGPRVSELAALDLADVDMTNTPATLRIREGKGEKSRTVYLVSMSIEALRDWLAVRPTDGAPSAMFLTLRGNQEGQPGQRISARSLRRRVDRYLVRAGLKKPGVSVHSLRHTYGTWASYAGASLPAIAADLGHANISTTQIYAQVADRIRQNPAAVLAKLYAEASSNG